MRRLLLVIVLAGIVLAVVMPDLSSKCFPHKTPTVQHRRAPAPYQSVPYDVDYIPVPGERIDSTLQDLDDDGRPELIDTCVDASTNPPRRRILIHSPSADFKWPKEPGQSLDVPEDAAVMIVGRYDDAPGMDLGFVTRDGVYLWPRDGKRLAESPRKILHTATFFGRPSQRTLPVWSWGDDLDKDGRSDLVLPTPQGYKIYLQTAPGVFGKMFTLEADLPPEKAMQRLLAVEGAPSADPFRSPAISVRRTLPRLFQIDMDSDGATDLVAFRGDTLGYYLQDPKTHAFGGGAGGREIVNTLRAGDGEGLVDVASAGFADIDHDGNVDLVVTKVKGNIGLVESIKTFVYIHFGTGYMSFNEQYYFELPGVGGAPAFIDMNGDGCLDMIAAYTPTSIVSHLLPTSKVEFTIHLYEFLPDKREFAKVPVTESALVSQQDIDRLGLWAGNLVYFNADWTGDGRSDMIRAEPDGALRVFQGIDSGGRVAFTGSAVWSIQLDEHPRGIFFADVNGDTRMDAVLFYPNRVGLLTSKR